MSNRQCFTAVFLVLFVMIFNLFSLAEPSAVGRQTIALNAGWEFRQQVDSAAVQQTVWRPAEVPGVVHTDLLRNKLIPDPFYRDNEAKLQWIEDANWEYRETFQVTSAMLKNRNIELAFEGLDAYAEVFLNGQQILTADNMFREWRVDVKSQLRAGENQLLVVFPSVIKQAEKIAEKDKWNRQTRTEAKTYIRKAAYEYGWDWGPRFVTSGIWRPVKLETWNDARIADFHIRQRDISPEAAHLTAEVEVLAAENTTAKVTVSYADRGKKQVERNVTLHAGVNHIDLPIDINKPDLWYPTGYGAQAMYNFDAQVRTSQRVEDAKSIRTGLRSVVLRRDVDQWGRSFEFVVNGIPVFGKGADVIPFDSFPTRVTTERYRQILESAKDANMNMIRHWGGGYYETDEFYEICDELGIMVWQDFMFGNDWQPGTYAFKQNVAAEAEDQLRRLRDHPSIVLWCGNNETEVAFLWHGRERLDPDVRIRMWGDYVSVFNGILARAVERLTPEVPYWPSSPSADYEDTSATYQSGDMHNWDIWHGPMLPLRDYEKFYPRFMSEYGFQSFPDMSTLRKFTIAEDRMGITTPVMLAHQKNVGGNEKIHEYMLRDYPEPKDFEAFLYTSQVLQAEGIKIGAEHLRRNRPRIMGSLYWQLNDCWPVASWASIDYYGHWKALQYYARRFYNDLLVSPHIENGTFAVYVVSDRTSPVSADLRIRLMTIDGKVLSDKTEHVEVPALSSKIYSQIPLGEFLNADLDSAKLFAVTDLTVGGKQVSSNLLYFVPTKEVHLPTTKINTELNRSGESYRLGLSSPVLARSVYVSFGDIDTKLSDNYFDLLPGQPIEIEIKSSASLDELRSGLKVVSLAGAFASSAGAGIPAQTNREPAAK